ncbi:MAG TPA: hypothetical protein VHS53_05530, partial [Mucilaginibacter sp.]|nr:hypothetical protein [Mucilaginibacter sp.]
MKINRSIWYVTGAGVVAAALAFSQGKVVNKLPQTVTEHSSLVRTDGNITYVDLNKNGKLDVYEDPRQPIGDRIQDLLKKMTIEEKAGMMFYAPVRVNADGTIEDKPATNFLANMSPVGINEIDKHHITHFNLFAVPAPDTLAMWYNRIQKYEQEKTRLGIPLTIASDPRNQGGMAI